MKLVSVAKARTSVIEVAVNGKFAGVVVHNKALGYLNPLTGTYHPDEISAIREIADLSSDE